MDALAQARRSLKSGDLQQAEDLARELFADDPRNVDAAQMLAVCLARRGAIGEALPMFEAVVHAQPNNIGPRNNLGTALESAGRHAEALACFDAALALDPQAAVLHGNRGNALKALGRSDEALASYAAAIALAPDHAGFRYNRGTTLHELRRPAEALADLDRAIALDPSRPSSWLNRGNVRLELRELEAALSDYEEALALDPVHARALAGRGVVLRELGRLDDAHASLDRALAANPELAIAHVERARVLRDLKQHDAALESFAAALARDAGFPYALGDWVRQKLECCDWDGLDGALARVTSAIDDGERACAPFQLLALPSSLAQQQACARIFVADRYPAIGGVANLAGGGVHDRLRVGYFSADFHDHATAHLITEVLQRHDRERFEITAFSFGPGADDPWRRRVASAVDRFLDVRGAPDAAIAAQARALGIDLAVDLKGHTQRARPASSPRARHLCRRAGSATPGPWARPMSTT